MVTSKALFNWRKVSTIFFHGQCRSVHISKRAVKTKLPELYSNCTLTTLRSNISSMTGDTDTFKLTNYDCIGFDLDNTLCRYDVRSMIQMEYEVLSNYLVEHKGYDGKHLLKPINEELGYIQKGLMLDFENGNILQIGKDGSVLRACHGTRVMNDGEIIEYYGPDRKWSLSAEFCQDVLGAWNGPLSLRLRTLLDSFDMPASLVFARIVDTLDENAGERLNTYSIWPDVLDGLIYMYQRENFAENTGGYFPSMKAAPEKYIKRCSDRVISWLKSVKKHAKTFLLTGSNVDFASFTAKNSLGENWLDYFDIVVCYARKPGFFTSSRPFLALNEFEETTPVKAKDMQLNNVYSQGNWQELLQFFTKTTGKESLKCLYVGDNLIQDVYVPSKYMNLDTVAIVDNIIAEEQMENNKLLSFKPWISYFGSGGDGVSIWSDITYTHSRICVPNIEVLAEHPVEYIWSSFKAGRKQGFHPNCPVNFL